MRGLAAEAARLAAREADRLAERLEAAARAELPGDVAVSRTGGDIRIEGKALACRALTELSLRGLGMLAKALTR